MLTSSETETEAKGKIAYCPICIYRSKKEEGIDFWNDLIVIAQIKIFTQMMTSNNNKNVKIIFFYCFSGNHNQKYMFLLSCWFQYPPLPTQQVRTVPFGNANVSSSSNTY